jgi:hypothetical protein
MLCASSAHLGIAASKEVLAQCLITHAQVMEKRRIIWCDYAAAFQAALECVNTKQSQDFAIKFIPKALPFLTGEGDPPQQFGHQASQPGSAWDDWCGEHRRKENHPAGQYDILGFVLCR